MKMKKNLSGFSLPELLLVLTILGILFSLTGVNLLNIYHKNTLNTTVTTFIADLKHEQLKAMVGDSEGQASPNPHGIYIQADRYTLFQGSLYSPSDPLNFVIKLNSDLQFSNISVPGSQIIFSEGSGEVSNYNSGYDNVTLKNIRTDETKTIRINKYGAVINIY